VKPENATAPSPSNGRLNPGYRHARNRDSRDQHAAAVIGNFAPEAPHAVISLHVMADRRITLRGKETIQRFDKNA